MKAFPIHTSCHVTATLFSLHLISSKNFSNVYRLTFEKIKDIFSVLCHRQTLIESFSVKDFRISEPLRLIGRHINEKTTKPSLLLVVGCVHAAP